MIHVRVNKDGSVVRDKLHVSKTFVERVKEKHEKEREEEKK